MAKIDLNAEQLKIVAAALEQQETSLGRAGRTASEQGRTAIADACRIELQKVTEVKIAIGKAV